MWELSPGTQHENGRDVVRIPLESAVEAAAMLLHQLATGNLADKEILKRCHLANVLTSELAKIFRHS